VWELRRYCTLSQGPQQATLRDGYPAPRVWLPGGYLNPDILDEVLKYVYLPKEVKPGTGYMFPGNLGNM
jgi:hypothetical protein